MSVEPVPRLVIHAEQQVKIHSGPIPSPEVLESFNQIDPSFADRIVKMAEDQSRHRQQMERTVVDAEAADRVADRREAKRGQWFAWTIVLAALAVATILGLQDRQMAASFIGTGGITGLAAVFVVGRLTQKRRSLLGSGEPNNHDKNEKKESVG